MMLKFPARISPLVLARILVVGGGWCWISADAFLVQPQHVVATKFSKVKKSYGYAPNKPSYGEAFSTALSMSLVPLDSDELRKLVAINAPTATQYSSYWGRTNQEKFGRGVESAIVSILGMCFSYFMSFVLGGFVATIFGSLFLFWGVLSPELKAYQRNWEFLGGRELVDEDIVFSRNQDPDRAGLYGALFLGHIRDVCVVESTSSKSYEYDLEEFADYDANEDELERFTGDPYLLRVLVADSKDRELQIHSRLMKDYLTIEAGMPVTFIMLSTTPRFDRLAAVTDLLVPESNCYIGDYPYLNRAEIEELLATDDKIWNVLQSEGYPEDLGLDEREDDDKTSFSRLQQRQ